MPDDSTKSSQVEDVVMSLKLCARSQIERAQALVDAATLAGEQIQDKRLELIAQGPDANIQEAVFNVLLSLVLDSTLGGRLLFTAAKKILQGPIRWASVFLVADYRKPYSNLGGFVAGLKDAVEKADESALAIMALPLPQKFEKLQLHHRFAATLVSLGSEKDAEKNWAALGKAANKARSERWLPKPSLSTFDSPGVALQSACRTHAMQQRYTTSTQLALFENIVRSYPRAIPTVEKLIPWDELTLEEITAIGSTTKLLFEAAIWAKLYGFDKELPFYENPDATYVYQNMTINFVPPKLKEYWWNRFRDLVVEWARRPESKVSGKDPRGPLGSKYAPTGAFLINQYFIALGRQFEKLPAEAFAISSPKQVQRARGA